MPGIEIVLGFLPFLGLLLTIYCFQKTAACPFDALMRGSLVWAFALVMCSNILSGLTLFSFPAVLAYWIIYLLFCAAASCRMKLRPTWPYTDKPLYVPAVIAALTFATAVLYPPNNWDSMTYHLPKVMHWWQNGSLEHYYTSNLRQTGLSPLAELVVFHSFVLSGTDYLANLVQWSAFIGIMCVVAATASLLGASKAGQVLAAFFFATLPMGIAQASSTQTDLVVGFWLSCVAARYIIWRSESSTRNAVYFGLAVGLAILTKGTAYIISLPFVIAFACFSIKKYQTLLPKAMLAGLIAISIFMPHIYRNYAAYNNPIAGAEGTILFPPSPESFVATTIANILANDPVRINKNIIYRTYEKLLTFLHIDPTDSTIFWGGIPVSSSRGIFARHEDLAQNPVHTILLIWLLSGIGIHHHAGAARYKRYVLASAGLFCLLLRWQPWITRLQVPLFALAAPLAGLALEKTCGEKLRKILCALLVLCCVPLLFLNVSRPLIPYAILLDAASPLIPVTLRDKIRGKTFLSVWTQSRDELYFCNKPDLRERYFAAVDILAKENADKIGLVIGGDSWEYPLWALLRTRMPTVPDIRHIVPPETADGWPDDSSPVFVPQYLFVLESKLAWEKQDDIHDALLRLFKRVSGVYERIF